MFAQYHTAAIHQHRLFRCGQNMASSPPFGSTFFAKLSGKECLTGLSGRIQLFGVLALLSPAGTVFEPFELPLEVLQFVVTEIFEIDQAGASPCNPTQQFIQLQVKRFGFTILGVLDEENHQESNDCSARVDHQLPGIGEVEIWAGDAPDYDGQAG
jgi:hypothetical protein